MKYGTLNLGQIEAIVNKLGGMEGVERLLRGEVTVSEPARRWREENGVIRFSVVTNGKTGEEWIEHLEGKKYDIGQYAKSVLRSKDFQPMAPGVTIEVAVLKGELFADNDRTTANIRAEAERRKLGKPNAELSCLIRDQFTNKEIAEMGLWAIIAMHDPIKDSDGVLVLLGADRGVSVCGLSAFRGNPGGRWYRGIGFALSVEQVA